MKHLLHVLARRERMLMDSRCTITRGTVGNVTTVATDVPCVVVPEDRVAREVEVGGETVRLHLYQVTLLPDQDVAKDDVITMTETRDAHLSGRHLTVLEVMSDDWLTNRRVLAMEGRS